MGRFSGAPIVLVILDGFGLNPRREGNAILLAKAPTFEKLQKGYCSSIQTSGQAVGLPSGQMGNSEVGHTNMGAGRIVYQDLTRITKSIREGDFFSNDVLKKIASQIRQKKSKLHLMGLVSDGGVHSHIEHLFALLKFSKQQHIQTVYVHCFLDGRDTLAKSSVSYIQQLENFMDKESIGKIATVSGRYYAMDRDNRWNRIQKTFDALTLSNARKADCAIKAIEQAHLEGETDEFVTPTVIDPIGQITDGDYVLFFNFRADRARQLTRAFTEKKFTQFKREAFPQISDFICMTQYDEKYTLPVIFPPVKLSHILGEVLFQNQIPQLRVAETEKYAHVTFFFNGGEEKVFPGEERILIPSTRDVPTYDLKPEMSAHEITQVVLDGIEKKEFGFIVVNFANADMVGHTGNLKAAIQAVETLDQCMAQIISGVQKKGGQLLITADHGNVEQMIDYKTGEPYTAHTTNPVPLYYIPNSSSSVKLEDGILADMMPTILGLMNLPTPSEVTGRNLIRHV